MPCLTGIVKLLVEFFCAAPAGSPTIRWQFASGSLAVHVFDFHSALVIMRAETIELSAPSSGFGEGEIWLDTYMLDVPVRIESVKAIVIDGVRIEL
ncbi:MAG: hypothetical protein LBT44_05600 [Clostridiales bacterium]|jgi:hypothetical protein|nr:hypothetical protein [Clostridiales bacterium]